jgi:5-methylcytosine-specific restriction endonuclease McrA
MTTNKTTLVLNSCWQPIGKVCWKKAFCLIFSGKANAIRYYEDTVKTPSDEFFVPAVIYAVNYAGQPRGKIIYSKRLVLERDDYLCQYCGMQLCRETATIDHVIPRSRGGKSTFINTVAACSPCNKKKADIPLGRSKVKLRKQPKVPYIHPLRGKINVKNIEPEWTEHLMGVI